MGKHTEQSTLPLAFVSPPPPASPRATSLSGRRRRLFGPVSLALGGLLACGLLGFAAGVLHRIAGKPSHPPGAARVTVAPPSSGTAVAKAPATTDQAPGGTEPLPVETLGRVAAAQAGTWVTNGVLQYVVVGQQCAISHVGVGTGSAGDPGREQFCLLTLRVRNRGPRPLVFSPADQVGYATDGNRYQADAAATRFANGTSRAFLTALTPWQVVTGVLAFDLPHDQTLTDVRLHSAQAPASVTVRLL